MSASKSAEQCAEEVRARNRAKEKSDLFKITEEQRVKALAHVQKKEDLRLKKKGVKRGEQLKLFFCLLLNFFSLPEIF